MTRETAPARKPLVVTLFAIAALCIAIDQGTKALAIVSLEGRPSIPILGELVQLTFYRNPGAAFGMGAQSTWLFAAIGCIVFVVILWLARRLASRGWAVALGLLLGGLTGNLIDRLFRPPAFFQGAVVDFLDLYFFICNLADVAITAAAVLMILLSFRGVGVSGRIEDEPATRKEAEA